MSLELTARLTLSSCVSQLTDFYTTNIQEVFTDEGIAELTIHMVDDNGEILPYMVVLTPIGAPSGSYKFTSLECILYRKTWFDGKPVLQALFTCSIGKGKMRVSTCYKCALHVCGDVIKFNEKGLI
jgi:hypothetical protein